MKIVLATKNKGKIAEFSGLFRPLDCEVVSLLDLGDIPTVEEDGATFLDNAVKKAKGYSQATGLIALADDSGLEVDALGGAPGVHSARYAGPEATDEENNAKLLRELEGMGPEQRTCRFKCVLALYAPGGELLTAEGACEGVVAEQPLGDGGFGYDPIFYIPELGRSMAQLTPEEKNRISHRGRAIRELEPRLRDFLAKVGG